MARIRSVKPELPPLLAAEFRGLFFGEGHIDLMTNSKGTSLYPRVRLAVRDDDRAIAEWCQNLFGGSITRDARTRSVCWQATGRDRLVNVVAALQGGSIPSKKRPEVVLLAEAVGLIGGVGVNHTPRSKRRLVEIRDELKRLRRYEEAA